MTQDIQNGSTGTTLMLIIGESQFILDGQVIRVDAGRSVHQAAIAYIAQAASGPVQVTAVDDGGTQQLQVGPDGSVTSVGTAPVGQGAEREGSVTPTGQGPTTSTDRGVPAKRAISPTGETHGNAPDSAHSPTAAPDPQPSDQNSRTPYANDARTPYAPATAQPVAAVAPQEVPQSRAERRASMTFLPGTDEAFSGMATPAKVGGWHGFLQSIGLEKKVKGPTPEQITERAELRAISQHWAGPRTIAIVNPKGGAGKTPTAVLLAAMFARWGGAGCLAWDNNETRGTMGWRTEQGPHEAHVRDLLGAADDLMRPEARAADLAAFVHHQTEDKYDVLRSNPRSIAPEERLTSADLDALHRVAARYYRLIFIDSGNDESAANWLRMIEHTDQLVVATTTRPDHAEAARLVLDDLHAQGQAAAQLADDAVVVVAHADQNEAPGGEYLARFEQLARAAAPIPYDPGMRAAHLRLDGLRPDTQVAWRHAAALVAGGLGTQGQTV
ncbi:ATPase [Allobranchiibius sp. GilTou38]|uniref:ATPase n=1 Tax=Allobranchiibius sp. GilTou38 TaxID=2815210 RepID=UPI001AA1A47D|nr:ATPase [Allobranchiibius sp. GilTou38]MBO1768260.1 ATPase [Allobranchiibius sp. GilTou38]